jgi:catechol 2,3-dioxygenase-like lactoylglutathione lyase family enzyme
MSLTRLDHFTIRCADLEKSRAFYRDVLGLKDGARPAFGFPGAWLYVEDRPVVHLIGGPDPGLPRETGHVDHVAFAGGDLGAMRDRLAAGKIAFEERRVPGAAIVQLFVHDPDGIAIELNFSV